MQLNNRVVKINRRKTPVMDRIARSAILNCTNDEWLDVIAQAQAKGIIPKDAFFGDIVDFNRQAAEFDGTVRDLLQGGAA